MQEDTTRWSSQRGFCMAMERRILLALALSFLLITLTRPFWEPRKPQSPPAGKGDTPKAHQIPPRQEEAVPQPGALPQIPGEAKAAQAENWVEVESDLYKIRLSNREAVVRSWVLKKYDDSHGKPLDFVEDKKR